MIKKLLLVFILAFLLNLLWENLHAPLYVHYQGEVVTQTMLIRAALFDAMLITILGALFLTLRFLRERLWFVVLLAVVFAVGLELWALGTFRWAYTDAMPIIPFITIGLTPTIQLGFLTYVIFKIVRLSTKP